MTTKILEIVSEVTGISIKDMKSRSRKEPIAEARGLFYLTGRLKRFTYSTLGEALGRSDSVAVSTVKSYSEKCEVDERLNSMRLEIFDKLGIYDFPEEQDDPEEPKPLWGDGFFIGEFNSRYFGDCYVGFVKGEPRCAEKTLPGVIDRMLDLK